MSSYRALVEYDGTRYSGFQIQANRLTVQGELERVLLALTGANVRVNGAGRTDAGVHARGQVISFAGQWRHSASELCRALNAKLPVDIAVREVAAAPPGFHARYSARSREYVYRILNSEWRTPLQERYAWRVAGALALHPMRRASSMLVGAHDYAAFGQPTVGGNTQRTILRAEWLREPSGPAVDGEAEASLLTFSIEANGFLRGMVRRIVGTLLMVGQERLQVPDFQGILLSRDISRAAAPAPARGLVLWRVRYDEMGPAEQP